jgi:hypothetical protein
MPFSRIIVCEKKNIMCAKFAGLKDSNPCSCLFILMFVLFQRGKSEDKFLDEVESQKFHKRARSSPESIALDCAEKAGSKLASTREDAEGPGPSFTAAFLSGFAQDPLRDTLVEPPFTSSPSAKPCRSHSDYTGTCSDMDLTMIEFPCHFVTILNPFFKSSSIESYALLGGGVSIQLSLFVVKYNLYAFNCHGLVKFKMGYKIVTCPLLVCSTRSLGKPVRLEMRTSNAIF